MSEADKLRAEAKEKRDLAKALVADPATDLIKLRAGKYDATNLVTAIVGYVASDTAEMIARVLDAIDVPAPSDDPVMARRQRIMSENNAVRVAASKAMLDGDWTEFDRLANGDGASGGSSP